MNRTSMLDRVLVAVFVIAAALWMVRAHQESVDVPSYARKAALHENILANRAADPYQYKNWIISHGLEAVHEHTGVDLDTVFRWNTLLSIVFMVLLHHLWLRQWAGPRGALIGTLTLAALASVLFRTYYHHPYEFWGVGLFCLLLVGLARDWNWLGLCALGLVTGLVWEKHAFLAVIWVLWHWQRGAPFVPTGIKGLAFLVACVAIPIGVRLFLDHDLAEPRALIDGDTPLSAQKWELVAWYQSVFVLPFVLVALARWRAMPAFVRWLWLYLPALVAAYISQSYILHEVRSFWPLVPVFTATLVLWLAPKDSPSQDAPREDPGPTPSSAS